MEKTSVRLLKAPCVGVAAKGVGFKKTSTTTANKKTPIQREHTATKYTIISSKNDTSRHTKDRPLQITTYVCRFSVRFQEARTVIVLDAEMPYICCTNRDSCCVRDKTGRIPIPLHRHLHVSYHENAPKSRRKLQLRTTYTVGDGSSPPPSGMILQQRYLHSRWVVLQGGGGGGSGKYCSPSRALLRFDAPTAAPYF